MRDEVFHETHDVVLDESDRNLRGRQAARLSQAIQAQKARAKAEEEAWKARKKALEAEEEKLVASLYEVGRAAETGVEPRPVPCKDELIGVMVCTIRQDTHETVGTRAASPVELREHHVVLVPGGGATGPRLVAPIGEHLKPPSAKH